jgi:hypothetical protein
MPTLLHDSIPRRRRAARGARVALGWLAGAWTALALGAPLGAPGAPDERASVELARDVHALVRLQAARHELERAQRENVVTAAADRTVPATRHTPGCAGPTPDGRRGAAARVARTWRLAQATAGCAAFDAAIDAAPMRERPARSVQYFSDGRRVP